jgi:hypothetical protein
VDSKIVDVKLHVVKEQRGDAIEVADPLVPPVGPAPVAVEEEA